MGVNPVRAQLWSGQEPTAWSSKEQLIIAVGLFLVCSLLLWPLPFSPQVPSLTREHQTQQFTCPNSGMYSVVIVGYKNYV